MIILMIFSLQLEGTVISAPAPTVPSSIYDTECSKANAIRVHKPTFPEDTVEQIVQLSTFPDNMVRTTLEYSSVPLLCMYVCMYVYMYIYMYACI